MTLQRTPLQRLPRLSDRFGVDLYVKRDDLFPFVGSGNKARKIIGFVKQADAAGCDALVTTGGVQSNHARVTALHAAARGWRCRLVLHGEPGVLQNPRGNLLLMLLAGADVTVVSPKGVPQALETVQQELVAGGHRPLVIPGGGHSLTGALAYVEAASELREQCDELEWHPDWMILPSGTGTTQAGLVVGFEQLG
jgi:D-cysteine desulfhydrase